MQCPARRARETFDLALAGYPCLLPPISIVDLGADTCRVEAPSLCWTLYWCALSTKGPADLHPFALRLASRFMRGSDHERYAIARTVLGWRGLDHLMPCGYEPGFDAIRYLPLSLGSLDWSRAPDPLQVASLMLPLLPHEWLIPQALDPSILNDPLAKWEDRNLVACNWLLRGVELKPPPARKGEPQRFSLPSCYTDNNQATLLALAFQSMEGSQVDSPYALNYMEESFVLAGVAREVWMTV